jgi:predicted PhzF superfamily epimerase YddE/YHI9
MKHDGVEKLVLMAKKDLLGFYVQCGFTVTKVSDIVHGQDLWYDCELPLKKEGDKWRTGHACWVLDSFAEKEGSGNPSAVVLLPPSSSSDGTDDDAHETTEWMKVVAKEFNLSETAFIWPSTPTVEKVKEEVDGGTSGVKSDDEEEVQQGGEVIEYVIRYFTCNGTEVDLCGHATLASAAVLFQTLKIKNDATIVFEAKKDTLTVSLDSKTWMRNAPIKLKMDFPKKSLREITSSTDRCAILDMLKTAFSMDFDAENILYLGLDEDGGDLLIELTRDYFLQIGYNNIHYSALMEWDGYSRGVILCCREDHHYPVTEEEDKEQDVPVVDFLSRFFGPKAGINEDPVTGSAHCTLGPYFSTKLHKTTLVGKQMSERGGTVMCVLDETERVSIIGTAITTMTGSLHIASSTCN